MIRDASESDIEGVYALEASCFSIPWSREGFRDNLGYDDTAFLVDERDGGVAGFAILRYFPDEAELYNIAVAEKYRRLGIGNELLAELIRRCEERKILRILLEVRQSNAAARALYKKHGFTVLGVRKGYYDAPKEDAVIMERTKE